MNTQDNNIKLNTFKNLVIVILFGIVCILGYKVIFSSNSSSNRLQQASAYFDAIDAKEKEKSMELKLRYSERQTEEVKRQAEEVKRQASIAQDRASSEAISGRYTIEYRSDNDSYISIKCANGSSVTGSRLDTGAYSVGSSWDNSLHNAAQKAWKYQDT